ncbi:MAG: thioredoxin family protein [Candidatus Eiseniibacteriota bacterium]
MKNLQASSRLAASRILPALLVLVFLSTPAGAAPAADSKAADSKASHAKAAGRPKTVPFIEDDYAKALSEARARKVPIFLDSWATWCHTCRSMMAFVFTDPALASRAGEFVWLSIDVEKPQNAPVRVKYPAAALPTFFVVDPDSERVVRRWVGGMTIKQLDGFLDEGKKAYVDASKPAESALARGDRLYGEADYKGAALAYEEALPGLESDPANYARVAEALSFSLSMTDQNEAGVKLAQAALPKLGRTTSGASLAVSGLAFALALPPERPGRASLIAHFEQKTREALDDPTITLADDDRSGLYATLMEARQDAKDEAGAKKAALAWATFLDGAAARAKTPDERAVFDSHRLSAYLELGEPEKAVGFLKESEKAAPGDYNPSYRLALAYNAMKQWDDALDASQRSLALAYGPRKIRIYNARTDSYIGKGDKDAARKTLDEAIRYAEALPEGQRSESSITALRKRRDDLS